MLILPVKEIPHYTTKTLHKSQLPFLSQIGIIQSIIPILSIFKYLPFYGGGHIMKYLNIS